MIGLHRALAERARADDGRALVVLQRAGDDLGGRGRSAVDEHDDLLAVSLVARVGIRRCVSSALRPLVVTMAPSSRKSSDTAIA